MGKARWARRLAGLAMLMVAAEASAADPQDGLAAFCGDCRPVHYAHCGGFLEGPNFDRDGKLWAVDLKGGTVLTIAPEGCATVVKTDGEPNGARFGPGGRLYVADARRGLLIYDPATGKLTVRADHVAGEAMVGANDIALDEAGGLYLTVRGTSTELEPTGRLIYLPPEPGAEPRVFADHLPFPNGVAVTGDGKRVLVGLYADESILALTAARNPAPFKMNSVFLRTEGGAGPDGMAVDPQGRLVWAEYGDGSVGVADAAGRHLGRIELPPEAGRNVTNVTFHAGWLYITEASKGDVWRVALR